VRKRETWIVQKRERERDGNHDGSRERTRERERWPGGGRGRMGSVDVRGLGGGSQAGGTQGCDERERLEHAHV